MDKRDESMTAMVGEIKMLEPTPPKWPEKRTALELLGQKGGRKWGVMGRELNR